MWFNVVDIIQLVMGDVVSGTVIVGIIEAALVGWVDALQNVIITVIIQ